MQYQSDDYLCSLNGRIGPRIMLIVESRPVIIFLTTQSDLCRIHVFLEFGLGVTTNHIPPKYKCTIKNIY